MSLIDSEKEIGKIQILSSEYNYIYFISFIPKNAIHAYAIRIKLESIQNQSVSECMQVFCL